MDDWAKEKQQQYYVEVADLIYKEFEHNNYINNNAREQNLNFLKDLGAKMNDNHPYKLIPYHIFDLDSSDGYKPKIYVLDGGNLLSLQSELPLLDSISIKHYESLDYLKNTRNSDNLLLNKVVFSKEEELDVIIEELQNLYESEIASYLIFDFHFTRHKRLFENVIIKVIADNREALVYDYNDLMKLLTLRDQYLLDEKFIDQISIIDTEKILYDHFIASIESNEDRLGSEKSKEFKDKLKEIYEIKSSFSFKEIIQDLSKSSYLDFDYNDDGFSDVCIVDSKNNILVYKGISDEYLILIHKNKSILNISNPTCPDKTFSKFVSKKKILEVSS